MSARSEARASGAVLYMTGTPCKRGHSAPRYTSNAVCTECLVAQRDKWSSENFEKSRQQSYLRTAKYRGHPVPTRPRPEICECCGARRRLALDHDHVTGMFRGWLCFNCNTSIGKLGDTEEGVWRALTYLRRAA